MLSFNSDYLQGAHPKVLERLVETNMVKSPGYGTDDFCASAREKIRQACGAKDAEVFFLSGGTQTNAMMVNYLLRPYQGVIAANTGHIVWHEAGAIERGGHKLFLVPEENGKLSAASVEQTAKTYHDDDFNAHMVEPGMVYISQPTESGTLYSLQELEEIAAVCRKYHMYLYLDGARLAYALACPSNDVTLEDIARLCDAFYIGGTKCGTLFGEAVVMPKPGLIPHFFTLVKQHGALLAKGRILGIQFETLFTDGLYFEVGRTAVSFADEIRQKLQEKGIELCYGSPTNQIFVRLTNELRQKLEQQVTTSFWERTDEDHVVIRLATSWATTREDVDALLKVLDEL